MGRKTKKNRPAEPDSTNLPERVDIFSYFDYREYLVAMYQYMKENTPKFSDRYFARVSGLGSSSYLRMVMRGQRNLTAATAGSFARGLKLNRKESAYFEALVMFKQARTEMDRERYMNEILRLRAKPNVDGLRRDQLEYVRDSLYVVIREMAVLPGFQDDPNWIAEHLYRRVTPAHVRHALEVLERLELLQRDESGHLKHTYRALESAPDADAVEYLNYHRRVLAESREAIVNAPFEEWDASSKTIAISKQLLPKVMEMLRDFQRQLDDVLQTGPQDYHEVYQINMQLFPVTRTSQGKGEK